LKHLDRHGLLIGIKKTIFEFNQHRLGRINRAKDDAGIDIGTRYKLVEIHGERFRAIISNNK
jgi:hypothetical protein